MNSVTIAISLSCLLIIALLLGLRYKSSRSNNLPPHSSDKPSSTLCTFTLDLQGHIIDSSKACNEFWTIDISEHNNIDFFTLLNISSNNIEHAYTEIGSGYRAQIDVMKFSANEENCGLRLPKDSWIEFSTYPVLNKHGDITALQITCVDITGRQYAINTLQQIAESIAGKSGQGYFDNLVLNLANIFDARYVFIGIYEIIDGVERIRSISSCDNDEIIENFSYDLKDTPCAMVVGQETCKYPENLQALFPRDIMLQTMGIDGYIGAPMSTPDDEPLGIVVISDTKPMIFTESAENILEIFAAQAAGEILRQRAENRIHQIAYQDSLTKLPNRSRMLEVLQETINESKVGNPATVYLLDINNFKNINESLGFSVGDEVLSVIGQRLQTNSSKSMSVFRVNSDEFLIIDSDPAGKKPHELAKKVRSYLSEPIYIGDRILNLESSIGIVVLPNKKAENVADILRFADTALRSAKGSTNGAQCLFEAIQLKDANERLSLEQGIRHGLENNDFALHYQPQVDMYGQPIGAEVLARWHSALGSIPPGKFIPVAEETGLILKLGSWVIDEACRQLSAWDTEGLNFPGRVSINVSAWQFSQPNFNGEINHILDRHNIHPSRITLEVTETVLMQNIHETSSKLKKLRNEGYHISLDDFGTGYSSLAYLRDLPLDCLKIDKSFVDTIEPGRSEPLIESMISIGRHMDLDIIAEGVETDAQYQELLKMRCKGYQGYLFAKPLPAVKFAEWLRRSTDSNNNLKYIHQV